MPLNDDWGSSPDVILAEELHAHHGEDEDDDAEDEGQVGERPHRVHHDRQDVVQRFPRLCQLEHPVIITKVFYNALSQWVLTLSFEKAIFLG